VNVSNSSNTATCYYLGAHGNSGNFAFIDGHVSSYQSPAQFLDVFDKEYSLQGQTYYGTNGSGVKNSHKWHCVLTAGLGYYSHNYFAN